MVEGGAVPIDMNLTVKTARFSLFTYPNTNTQTTAALLDLVNDDGHEFNQAYSVSDPGKFIPSEDGKTLVAVGDAQELVKSSNFFLLMNAFVNAGFPENRLGDDISVIEGYYGYWIGIPEPSRPGLNRQPAAGARPKVYSVPSKTLRLPWEKKPAGGKAPAVRSTVPAAVAKAEASQSATSEDVDPVALSLKFVRDTVKEGTMTRQVLAGRVFKDLAKDPNKNAIAGAIFKLTAEDYITAGYTLDGENVTRIA
jgi:hypothetical protein